MQKVEQSEQDLQEPIWKDWEFPKIEKQSGEKWQHPSWDIKTYSGKEKYRLVYKTDKETEWEKVIKNGKCYIYISVIETGMSYSIDYLYSNVAGFFDTRNRTEYFETNVFKKQMHCEDNPFVDCDTPGNSKEDTLTHRYGEALHKNQLSDIIIDYLLNNKDIFTEDLKIENGGKKESEKSKTIVIKFKEMMGIIRKNDPDINRLEYTITLVDNDTKYSMYFIWDIFNNCHPQCHMEEENCMTHCILPKNDFTKMLVKYLFMDEEELSKDCGLGLPNDYKRRIIRFILPTFLKNTDSTKTIITCVIPGLWD